MDEEKKKSTPKPRMTYDKIEIRGEPTKTAPVVEEKSQSKEKEQEK